MEIFDFLKKSIPKKIIKLICLKDFLNLYYMDKDKKTDSFKFCKLMADIESGKVEPKKRKKKMSEIFIIIKKKNSKK